MPLKPSMAMVAARSESLRKCRGFSKAQTRRAVGGAAAKGKAAQRRPAEAPATNWRRFIAEFTVPS
jgi:hypothetical protein